MVAKVFKTERNDEIDETEMMKPLDYEPAEFPLHLMSRKNFFPSFVSFSITSPLIMIASLELVKKLNLCVPVKICIVGLLNLSKFYMRSRLNI